MTLDEFIQNKPPELRLRQHLYNRYLYKLKLQHATQHLYNTTDEKVALSMVVEIMKDYQWTELM